MYVVCLDNGQIVYVRDVHFYKKDPFIGRVDEEALLKAVFDEETEGFILREIIFGSGDRLLSSRILGSL